MSCSHDSSKRAWRALAASFVSGTRTRASHAKVSASMKMSGIRGMRGEHTAPRDTRRGAMLWSGAMRYLVVGCGAIGGIITSALAEIGEDVTALTTNAHIHEAATLRGLEVVGD